MRGPTTHAVTAVVAGLVLALVFTTPAISKDKEQPIESYTGHYINPNPGPTGSGRANFLDIDIYRWTTDEERQGWAETLASKGSQVMVDQIRNDKSRVGWIKLPGTVSYDLKYARAFDTPQGRQIVLATDRPLAMAEIRYDSRTLDYGLTIIEFLMPSDGGAGQGSIIVGADLSLKNDKLTIENVSFQPLRFEDIKARKTKKK